MKALITDIVKEDRLTYVVFSCPAGEGFGIWRCASDPERIGYDVEFDFDQRVQTDMIVYEDCAPSFTRIGEKTAVHAKVDAVDDDGMAYLRLHASCLVMSESDLTPSAKNSRIFFTLRKDQITLTPFGI
jgi:hypothetical protein